MIRKLFWELLMRIDIESKNKFNVMIKKVFNDDSIPLIKGCSINSKNIKNRLIGSEKISDSSTLFLYINFTIPH